MDPLILSRWQFAITTIYHFFFVPLTLGLSILIAIFETRYVISGDETYKRMTKFWGKVFLINFAAGVVTGIIQEFHFGLNWSGYARFMGDIFGAPLAIEALLAFYLESTFLGVWIFGWDKLPKKVHAVVMWLVAIGSNLSALWILIANSFMQNPVGYAVENGRAVMTNFVALITNPNVLYQFPHVLFGGVTTAGFIVLGFSAYHLLRGTKGDAELFRRSFRWAAIYALVGVTLTGVIGHLHGQFLGATQPMKTSAAEALWETEQPADFVLIALTNQEQQENPFEITIPKALSFLLYNNFTGQVPGLKELQAEAVQKYGPGNYIPSVLLTFWPFRFMVGFGTLMGLLGLIAVFWRKAIDKPWFLKTLLPSMALPYLAITFGWINTEESRQPWIVYGLLRVKDAVSPNITTGTVLFSLILFLLLLGALTVLTGSLLYKFGTIEPAKAEKATEQPQEAKK